MPPNASPVINVAAIRERFGEIAATFGVPDRALAELTLERIQPPNWTLEWYLPVWLGGAFGVDVEIARRVTLSNVLGLAAIRLEDDLRDGDVRADEVPTAGRVAGMLFTEAVALYGPLFPPTSPFWSKLQATMTDWRSSGSEEGADTGDSPPLARRGAPLKIGARAIWLFGDGRVSWELVDRCLDVALVALARYDDLCDWEADLAAGRWNAFVASCTGEPQTIVRRSPNWAAVLVAILTRGAARAGFEQVATEARRASELAVELGSVCLADHLVRMADRAAAQGITVDAHFQALASRATSLIFGGMPVRPVGGLAPGGP